jgi:type I restriction enzyme S subunit
VIEPWDGWKVVPLGSLLADSRELTYGVVQPGSPCDDGVPLLRVKDIRDGRIAQSELMRIEPSIEESYERSRLRGGELLVTLVGTVGEVAVAPQEMAGWNVARAVGIARFSDPSLASWITYCIRSPEGRQWIQERVNTTVQTTFNLKDLREFPVVVPSPPEQRAIAEVLGALDDKIESNRRIVQNVGDLSTTFFNEWRLAVSDWTNTTFGEFASVYGGATPKTGIPEYWDGPHCWLTPTDVTHLDSIYLSSSARTITNEGLASASTELHPPGTIFMTSRATIGAFAINQVPCAPNQGFIAVRPANHDQRWFLFHEMSRRVPEMLDRANGTTFREISRGSFKSMELLIPADDSAHGRLDAELSPLHDRAAQAVRETSFLSATRDILLPALLSGRIRVPVAAGLVEAQ